MAVAALLLVFLILVMIFYRLLTKESVKVPAATLARLVMGSAVSSWNSLFSCMN